MLRLHAKTESSEDYKDIEVPICWEEVNVELFQKIASQWDGDDQIKLFSILTGIKYAGLRASKDKNMEAVFLASIRFVYEQKVDWPAIPVPEFFDLGGKSVRVPKNLGRLSLGQNIAIRQAMTNADKNYSDDQLKVFFVEKFLYDELIAYTVAVYLQPLVDGIDFDDERAAVLEKEILQMPIMRVYGLGFFFLSQLLSSGKKQSSGLSLKLLRSLLIRIKSWLN